MTDIYADNLNVPCIPKIATARPRYPQEEAWQRSHRAAFSLHTVKEPID